MRQLSAAAARVVTRSARWNSTAEVFLKPEKQPVDPSASPDASSVPHPRFQSLRVHAGSSFKPNLDVLASTAVKGSLSSRLAQHRVAEQKPAPVSTSRSSASLELQHEYLTARRAERLAREAAGRSEPPSQSLPGYANALLPSTPPSTPSLLTPSLPLNRSTEDSKAMDARRQLLLGRRAERMVREANTQPQSRSSQPRVPSRGSASGPEQPSRNTPLVVGGLGTPEGNTTRTSQGKFKSRGGATTRGGMRGGMRGGRGRSASGRRAVQGRAAGQDDEWPPEIAEWVDSDEIHLASSLGPELRMGDLGRVFRHHPSAITSNARTMREHVGGDYSRFTPENPQQFIAAAKKLGPVKHSSVALARSNELPVRNRVHVRDVVGSVLRL